jgi:hypothetical protein
MNISSNRMQVIKKMFKSDLLFNQVRHSCNHIGVRRGGSNSVFHGIIGLLIKSSN